jgi:hypothetical protein
MPSHCMDIETLLPTYLDGELAPHDQLSFEHHMVDCVSCRDRVRDEASYLERVRQLLTPPAAPAALAGRVRDAIDQQDRRRVAARRRAGWAWALPGGAATAAAAALALFAASEVAPRQTMQAEAPTVRQVVRDRFDDTPLWGGSPREISLAAEEYLRMPLSPPRFSTVDASLKGWRPRQIDGRLAAMLVYDVSRPGGQRHQITVHVLNARDLDLHGRERRVVSGKELWVASPLGVSTVSYKDRYGIGYVFSSDIDMDDLMSLVVSSDLLYKVNESLIRK